MPETISKRDLAINLGILVLAFGSIYFASQLWGADAVKEWVESAGPWAPLAVIAAKASTIIFAPLNGSFLYPLSGGLFGFGEGLLYATLGDIIGCSTAFFLSRRFGRRFVDKMLGKEDIFLGRVLTTMGSVRGFFMTRLILITAQDLLAYAAGLTRLRYIHFILIHISIGLIPTALLVGLGSSLLTNPTLGSLGALFAGSSVIGIVSVALFLWYISRQKPETPGDDSTPPVSEAR